MRYLCGRGHYSLLCPIVGHHIRERTNCMHCNRGNLTVGLKTETVGFVGLIFQRPQIFFHNFVSFHPILMFNTILESGDQTKTIEDEFKTIRLIQINT